MKTIIFSLLLMILMIGSTSCKKEVIGDPVLTLSATTVSTDQELTITLSGVEQTNCHTWIKVSGPDYTTVSGGGEKDKTWTIKFNGTGTAVIQCSADYCRFVNHGAPCGGHGCRGAKMTEVTIPIQ